MERISQKLKSKKGVTIVMGLLFFLVATMVSSVMLAVASSASRKIVYDREEQQAYLNVSSVGEYLRDEISKYSFTTIVTQQSNGVTKNEYFPNDGGSALSPVMNQIVDYKVNTLSKNATAEFAPIKFKIKMGGDGIDLLEDEPSDIIVTVEVVNSKSSSQTESGKTTVTNQGLETLDIILTVESQPKTAIGNEQVAYRMTVYMQSNYTTLKELDVEPLQNGEDLIKQTVTNTYSWTEGIVERGYGQSQ